jgi:hypothetical protein
MSVRHIEAVTHFVGDAEASGGRYISWLVGRTSISLTATWRGRVTM